jgi:hypothetical protein
MVTAIDSGYSGAGGARRVSRGGRLGAGAAAAGAALLLVAGCGGGSPSALPADAAGPTGSPSPPAAPAAGGPVLTAYLAYWDAVIHAHRTINPADPDLARHAAGAELAKVRGVIARNRQQRISIRGAVSHRPAVTAVTGVSAAVEDCYDVSGWNPVDVRTGKPIDAVEAGGTGRYKGRFGLRHVPAGWYVVSSATLGAC